VPTPDTLREIRRATRHHGVTTNHRLRLTQRQTDICCADGTLLRKHEGVYVDPAHPRSRVQDLAAAVAAGGPLCAAWARSSAAVWMLWDDHPAAPEVVVPYGRLRLIGGATVHRSRVLTPSMVTTRDHIRVVKPLVTVLDLGVVVGPVEVGDVIIRGRQRKLFTVDDVAATIRRHARPGRTGVVVARRALDMIMIGERPADSVLEFRFHIGPAHHGLPPYSYQHEVRIGRKRYFIDFAYPEVMLAIEVDGYQQRSSKESLAYDNNRANQLVLAGWTILRFGWDRVVNDQAGVAAEILLKLGQLGYRFRR
jgi:very-short-patch-repair endonuclease